MMCAWSGHNNLTQSSLWALSRNSGRDGGEIGPLPHLSVVPALDIKVILSYTPASFWGRDLAEGISQLPHPKGATPKSQGWTMFSPS